MSLRDQLLKAGVVSKADVRKVERDLKTERKGAQGAKRAQAEVRAEEQARKAAEEEAVRVQRLAERQRREAEKAAAEHRWRVRQIVDKNAIRSRGKLRYHFKKADGHIGRIEVSDAVGWKLRCGEAALALRPAVRVTEEPAFVVISAAAARRLREIEPEAVVHLVTDTKDLSAPEEAFLQPDWPVGLTARRLR